PLVPVNSIGARLRDLLSVEAVHEDRYFPQASLCGSRTARIAVDHGAVELTAREAASVLGAAELDHIALEEHSSGGVLVDPVLRVLQGLWEGLGSMERDELVVAVRREPLFPIGQEN